VALEADELLSSRANTSSASPPGTFCLSPFLDILSLPLPFALRLTEGEDYGVVSALCFFRSRKVIELGGKGMLLRDEDDVMYFLEPASRGEKIAMAR